MELDELLSIIENPTRRRILETIVKEPSYPLQLSKELGVSQQAVMKNLSLMEDQGMIVSYREASSIGPMRTLYTPNTEFTLMIDMHGNVFSARLISSGNQEDMINLEDIEEAASMLRNINQKIQRIEEEHDKLQDEKKTIERWFEELIDKQENEEDKQKLQEILESTEKEVRE